MNVTAYDFGTNLTPIHNPFALSYKYNVVFASNVINVQTSMEMLDTTLKQMFKASLDSVIFNYPRSPRKLPQLSAQFISDYVQEHFTMDISIVKGKVAPIFHCKV